MNCILLLLILFYCGNNGRENGNCRHSHMEQGCNQGSRSNYDCRPNHESCSNNGRQTPPPPPMPRTGFSYLDNEPCTCGCEDK